MGSHDSAYTGFGFKASVVGTGFQFAFPWNDVAGPGGEESCHQDRGKTKQGRAGMWERLVADYMATGRVTSVRPWGRVELSTSIWAGTC